MADWRLLEMLMNRKESYHMDIGVWDLFIQLDIGWANALRLH